MQPAAEHWRSGSRGAPTIRERRSVPSDIRGPGMGGRSDSKSSQHPAPQEVTRGNRHQNHQRIPNGIPHIGNRFSRVPSWELRGLALKRKYNQMRVWDPGEDSTEQAVPNDLGTAEEDAWDQW